MFLYKDISCPVCKAVFTEEDDIVVCPDCGTPHHRACYQMAGRCVNSGLHAAGYDFNKERRASQTPTQPQTPPQPGFYIPTPAQKEASRQDRAASPFTQADYFLQMVNSVADSNEEIEGKRVADIAATVNNNSSRFLSCFKKSGKLGWNWGAFFFGSLYFFYRKMYRVGVSMISLVAALICASNVALMKLAPQSVALLQEIASASGATPAQVQQKMLEMQSVPDFKKAMLVSYGTLGVLLLIHIAEALIADRVYKKFVFGVIDSTEAALENGAAFRTPTMRGEELNLNNEQMRRLYLARRGGVTVFAPFLAFMVVYLFISFI